MTTLTALAREFSGELHAPLALEGAQLEATLRPRTAAECARLLAALTQEKVPALIVGGGTQLAAANAPCGARVRIETSALREAPELDLDEGVARFGAGATLAEIAAQLEGSIWQLPLDPPGAGATLGGTLASAAFGPRFGHPRDFVLGLTLALASGDVAKCGGRVVKNVTGYDLNKLFVGSGGALGVITAAWLRLRPRPERTDVLLAPAPQDTALALGAARASSARACALLDATLAPELAAQLGGTRAFVLELAGDAAAVEADRAVWAAKLGALDAPANAVELVRAAQGGGALRFRVAALPSEAPALREALCAAGASTLVYPARGLVSARFEASDARAFEAQLTAVREAAKRAGGTWRLEAAPLALRIGREVSGEVDATLALQRALKRAYDPANVLNPGREFGVTR
ncbi:MAG: FAD-binding oxidoreductase [Deltaproteobacteria bacterium]|nr:FAD-binding oxidoreductase [Deltaproteobacteria bacterium]